jgi:RNA 2',3'-cyclic 3'-phosphodiesterase
LGSNQLAAEAPLIVRAFFGLPLPEPQRLELGRYLEKCAGVAPEFRWSAEDNLHITVRFIGNVERDVVEAIASRLDQNPGPSFDLALGNVGQFKRSRLARVVWLGTTGGVEELQALALRVEAECREAGLEPEKRAFQPHLTLARARPRDGATLPVLPPLPAIEPWTADELVLYWSHLGKGGAVHEPIRRIRLG